VAANQPTTSQRIPCQQAMDLSSHVILFIYFMSSRTKHMDIRLHLVRNASLSMLQCAAPSFIFLAQMSFFYSFRRVVEVPL
jgi:hypothetical protein